MCLHLSFKPLLFEFTVFRVVLYLGNLYFNITGDIVGYNVLRSWEFSSQKPIRSILYPYTVVEIPAILVNIFYFLNFKPDAYLLVTLPRFIMCMLSFLQDLCIYKICKAMKINYKLPLTMFASSYVTFTYLTRTFSNSIESLLFSFLILLLSEIWQLQNKICHGRASDLFFSRFMINSFLYGATLAIGCFNRPTFVCFSVVPMIIWFSTLFHLNISQKINYIAALLLGLFSMNICITAVDTLYYNKCHYSSIYNFTNIIHTPLNFIFYNLNIKNLESHGLHPRWLHTIVNIPLLFSVYGIILIKYNVKKIFCLFNNLHLNTEMILLLCFCVPLILLSTIPHQEPRFIVPLIVPFSILYGGESLRNYLQKKFCTYLWIISNALCLFFYGFMHQAGIYLSMQHINGQLGNNTSIIFYKTYMPPRYFLPHEYGRHVDIFDFAGSEGVDFKTAFKDVLNQTPSILVFIMPSNLILKSDEIIDILYRKNYKFIEEADCFPHLSMEYFPKLTDILSIWKKDSTYMVKLYDLKEMFSIHIMTFKKYQV